MKITPWVAFFNIWPQPQEFIYILAKIANVKTDPEELLTSQKSGLVKYLFGEDLKGELTSETFKELQTRLIDDVLSLEFTRWALSYKTVTIVLILKKLIDVIDFFLNIYF